MSLIEDNKIAIIKRVSNLALNNHLTISYDRLDFLLTEKVVNEIKDYPPAYQEYCAQLIYAMYIVHLIPFPKAFNSDGTGILRPANSCLSGLMLFYHTHLDELAIIDYSNKPNSKFPKLAFADDSHDLLCWGAGTKQTDFYNVDKPSQRIEAKYDYMNRGSVSSTHWADDIIDCLPGGGTNWCHYCAGQFMGVIDKWSASKEELPLLNRDTNKVPPMLKEDDLAYLQSGEILLELDKLFNIRVVPKRR